MTEHLVSRDGAWTGTHKVGLPARPQPEPDVAQPSEVGAGSGEPLPPLRWTRADRGWSPTSWRSGAQ